MTDASWVLTDLRTIERLAGRAATVCYSRTLPYAERHEAAYSAIALAVAEHARAGTHPTFTELVGVGSDAIDTETTQWRHTHGLTAPRGYVTYWLDDTRPDGVPDAEVPPRLALREVMDALPSRHAEALMLLALHGDPQAAAAHLGITYGAMQRRIRTARQAFYALWWDHETPPSPPFDRRAATPLPTHCGRGHEFTPENTRWRRATSGRGRKRACKACDGLAAAQLRERNHR